jgi:hypothetical protein
MPDIAALGGSNPDSRGFKGGSSLDCINIVVPMNVVRSIFIQSAPVIAA